jgi:hypothetical protein
LRHHVGSRTILQGACVRPHGIDFAACAATMLIFVKPKA